ncbi:MAG TPA: F0F1 ATP synthase subunit A [Micromonosporaceae bacterium]|nr:F0F1 ATP synthase subunit A [Micromonosporaceae bacterium]
MSGLAIVRAEEVPFPPSVHDFYPPSLVEGGGYWLTRFTLLVWVAVALLIVFFLLSYRDPKIVPDRKQWLAESVYGFVRDGVGREMIGPEGLRFAPYLATLFSFILLMNLFAIVPFIQVSPNSHIAFPAMLAVISWIMFMAVGVRRHGLVKYLKISLIPPAPWFVLPILIPIEFISTFLVRPFTLAVRLFANMFAGHMILLVFTLGGFALLNAEALFLKPISLLSWAMAIALTFLEAMVILLQAYVFVVLTASYVQGALAEEH